MNKKDREKIAFIIAEYEWTQWGGSAASTGSNSVIRTLREEFEITKEELAFPRAFVLAGYVRVQDNDELFDLLLQKVEESYEGVINAVEELGFENFRESLEKEVNDE